MQQRGVITTAVILALILAGTLWYTLTRDNGSEPEVTPTPSEVTIVSPTPTPIGNSATTNTTSPEVLPPITYESTPVVASAPTGSTENIVAGLVSLTVVGLWQLSKSIRRGLV